MKEIGTAVFKTTVCATLFVSVCFSQAFAAPTADDLKRIEAQLQKERQAGLVAQRKATELSSEMNAVRRQIMGSVKNVQEKEEVLSSLETRLSDLNKRQAELEKRIALNDAQMGQVLRGLQNLALRPKETLYLKPMAPIEMVRSQSLMQSSIPVLGAMNETARADLEELLQTRAQISSQAQKVKSAAEQLAEKKEQMERLLKQKQALQAQYRATQVQTKKRADALAAQASDLKDLLKKLEQEKRRQEAERKRKAEERRLAEERRQRMIAAGQTPPAPAPAVQERTPRKLAKGAFSKSYGSLLYPVRGRISKNFGDTTISGAHLKGMSITARPGAQVIAPFDGTVLFSGPFKSYGQLLIIDNGDNYVTLLAGMERIYVTVGQDLLAGEPVGVMGQKDPSIYIEIRKEGTAVNPRPWFPNN